MFSIELVNEVIITHKTLAEYDMSVSVWVVTKTTSFTHISLRNERGTFTNMKSESFT